ncbi:MAG: hypothetical protein ACR2HX_17525, partial [Pyrinomonadaceae bacterium]
LECGGLAPLWPAVAWHRVVGEHSITKGFECRRRTKAPSAGVPGAAAALGWSSRRTPKSRTHPSIADPLLPSAYQLGLRLAIPYFENHGELYTD